MKVRHGIPCVPRTVAKREYLRRRAAARLPGQSNSANSRLYKLCERLPDDQVREAVLRSMPSRSMPLSKCVRRLARSLKCIDRTVAAGDYAAVVSEWLKVACPGGAVGVWPQFVRAYEDADGNSPRSFVVPISAQIEKEGLTGESAVCRAAHLMARRFGRRVYISARVMAECTGLSKSACAAWFNRLLKRNVIRLVVKGEASPFDRLATVFDVSGLFSVGDAAAEKAGGERDGSSRATDADIRSASPFNGPHRPEPAMPEVDVRQKQERHLGITCVQPLGNKGNEPPDDGPDWSLPMTPGQQAAMDAREKRLEMMKETSDPW
jgi:hypothetical protein